MKKDINKEKMDYKFLNLIDSNEFDKAEKIIENISDPKMLLCFSIKTGKRLSPDKEKILIKNPIAALYYVKKVLKKRWDEAEKEIFKHKDLKSDYYTDVLNYSQIETTAILRKEDITKAKTLIRKEIIKTAKKLEGRKFNAKNIKKRFEESDMKVKEISERYNLDNETVKSLLKEIAEEK